MPGKLVLIDGHSLANRAFYAIRELRTVDGIPTNAIYGFVNMLLRVLEEEKPDYIAIAFDRSAPTFRHLEYEQYKATRTGMPDDLLVQIPLLKEVIRAFGICIYEIDGYEADDVIGAAAALAERKGLEVVIFSGDRDTLQLVSDKTTVMLTKRGITDIVKYTRSEMAKSLGLTPEQVPDYKALVGDASDNIPGVPGVGEKTATKLISEFGSVENLIARSEELPGKLRDLIEKHAEQIRMSKRLATIVTDVPLPISMEDCSLKDPDRSKLGNLFERLEFRSLMSRLGLKAEQPKEPSVATKQVADPVVKELCSLDKAVAEFARLAEEGMIALWSECEGGKPPESLLVSGKHNTILIRFGQEAVDFATFANRAGKSLADSRIRKMGHGLKPFIVALRRTGACFEGYAFDSEIAAYLLDPSRSNYRLKDLAREHLALSIPDDAPRGWESRTIYALRETLEARLDELGMLKLFRDVEIPLCSVLAGMEAAGIAVNREALRDMGKEFSVKIDALVAQIYRLAGEEFNINSTKQLGHILFEKMKLPAVKKTKTGYSTDAEVLEALAPKHEICQALLEYRQLVKLKGTYIDGLQDLIDPCTGRVHTTFNQTVTATGRLSSAEPNLQNIPIRQEAGRLIRKVFVPGSRDMFLLSADYSQIELRILAHMSGDENMIEAFRLGQDIHTRTAAEVFGVKLEEVNADMRRAAKAVNFGIVYGISDYGLAQNLGIPRDKARAYIQNYFARYPGVRRWIDETIARARQNGYVTTILGRRRYLPDLHSRNNQLRQFAERTAMNTPIQGSAADLIKLAMVKIDEKLKQTGSRSVMLLQVHDELIFEVPRDEVLLVGHMIKDIMANCMQFKVPIVVDLKVGSDWCDMTAL